MLVDVAIVGGGPAAWVAAAAVASRGLGVALLTGDAQGWAPNYGTWVEEAEAVGLTALATVWQDTEVVLADHNTRTLGRAYARVDKLALRAGLRSQALAAGVQVVGARALAVSHDAAASTVETSAGTQIQARVVVDATGHNPVFVRRAGEATLFQAAIGLEGATRGHPWSRDRMTLMDLRAASPALADAPVPSFLYAMPLGGERVFVEETSLIRGPAVGFDVLRSRLDTRLAAMGVDFADEPEVERCLIPMDTPLPDLSQRVVGFGGAASFVNPATGYQLGRVFATAPDLADSLATGLRAGHRPEIVARDTWRAIWTDRDLLRRELHLFGARVLADLDSAGQRSFFDAFFAMTPALWTGYLAPRGDLAPLARAMIGLLVFGDWPIRRLLLTSGRRLPGVLIRAAA